MGEPDPRRLPQRSAHARGPGAPGAGHRRSAIRDRRSGRHGRGRRGSGRPGKDRGPGDPARCVPAARFGAAVHRCRRGGRANARGSRLAGRGRGRRVVGDACPHRRRAAAADPGPRRAGRYGSRRGRSNGARPGQPVHALGGAQTCRPPSCWGPETTTVLSTSIGRRLDCRPRSGRCGRWCTPCLAWRRSPPDEVRPTSPRCCSGLGRRPVTRRRWSSPSHPGRLRTGRPRSGPRRAGRRRIPRGRRARDRRPAGAGTHARRPGHAARRTVLT